MKDQKLQVIEYLKKKHLMISSAESLTGGLFQATIVNYPGVSEIFNGGFVTYSNEVKHQLLGIPMSMIDDFGVVSSEVAIAMAKGCQKILESDIGVGFTGSAGPTMLNGKPVGTAWVGFKVKDQITSILVRNATLERNEFREYCVDEAFKELAKLLAIN